MFTSQVANCALGEVLDLVDKWQRDGRSGFCLPVIRDKTLEMLEILADERRRDNCDVCASIGMVEDMPCSHCEPMYKATTC